MAVVEKKRIRWTAAPDPDIVAHRVYALPAGQSVDIATDQYAAVPMPETSVIAPDDFVAGTFSGDVNYEVSIYAVDDVGNLSDAAVVNSPFDFIAPGAPTDIVVENV
jgi:hypothetical protein